MEKATIQIQVSNRGSEQVEVTAHIVVPGLAVHEAYRNKPGWTICHMPSGLSLFHALDSLRTLQEALGLCLLLEPLADWTLPADALLKAYPNLSKEVRRVRNQGSEPCQ